MLSWFFSFYGVWRDIKCGVSTYSSSATLLPLDMGIITGRNLLFTIRLTHNRGYFNLGFHSILTSFDHRSTSCYCGSNSSHQTCDIWYEQDILQGRHVWITETFSGDYTWQVGITLQLPRLGPLTLSFNTPFLLRGPCAWFIMFWMSVSLIFSDRKGLVHKLFSINFSITVFSFFCIKTELS